jgi:RNA polymerase sigma-70 factor (ECF subfamily)
VNSDDRVLVCRILAGDERAFDAFFAEYFPALYRFALSRLGHDEDAAEEIAQATLCHAMTKLDTFRGEAALFTWLCTLCRHEIWRLASRVGRRGRQVELNEESKEILDSTGLFHGVGGDTALALDRAELSRLVHAALDALPERYGSVLEWKYLDDVPVKEIASRLGVGPKAAESLLTRAREAFREAFDALTKQPRMRWSP